MISTIVSAWGAWPLFVGLVVVALTRMWQAASVSPELAPELALLWSHVPSRLRPLIAMVGAGAVAFGGALATGATWAGAGDAALAAWLFAAGGQEALRLVAGKVGS